MSPTRPNIPDPDDMFSDTRMSFGEHIEDLRSHLLWAIYGFLIGFLLSFLVAKPVLQFIAAPVEASLLEYYNEMFKEKAKEIMNGMQAHQYDDVPAMKMELKFNPEALRRALAGKEDKVLNKLVPSIEKGLAVHDLDYLLNSQDDDPDLVTIPVQISNPLPMVLEMEKLRQIVRPPTLSTLGVQEAFVVYIKIALLTGLVMSSPWVFYQIWAFVAAGLYPNEKKLVHLYLPGSLFLFLGGVFLCEFFVIPKAVEALLWFNKYLGLQPDLRLSEWLGFAIVMPLVFGFSFQTPLVMLFLERIGVVDVQFFRDKRKIAIMLLAVFSAVITPSTDPMSMLCLLVPMCLLYELGIWLCTFGPRSKLFESDFEESDELIEV